MSGEDRIERNGTNGRNGVNERNGMNGHSEQGPNERGERGGPDRPFDAVVIGGGSAGLSFAKRAAKNGASVALIEMDELGGTCVNRGCVPKKLLWQVAHLHRRDDALVEEGHLSNVPRLDLGRVQDTIADHLEGIRSTYKDELDDHGIRVVRSRATLIDARTVRCGDETIHTHRIVLATGSEPARLDVPGAELTEVSNDVFEWREPPEKLLILGGGYIGIEFATIFSGLGTQVVLADAGEEPLDGFDPESVAHVREHLEHEGVRFVMETELQSVERRANRLGATLSNGDTIECDRVLVAVGRTPRLEGLGDVADGLRRTDSGLLDVSDTFETSEEGIFAVGDTVERMALTPVAKRDGAWLADHLFGTPGEKLDLGLVASVTYADPPVAQIGRIGAKEPEDGLHVSRGTVSPLKNGLARNTHERHQHKNFFKLLSEGEDGPIRGVSLVSNGAEDEISWAAVLVSSGVTMAALARPAAVHPSFAEEMIGGQDASDIP